MRARVVDAPVKTITMSRPPVTSHVLNTATGEPAVGIVVAISKLTTEGDSQNFIEIGRGVTNTDGRVPGLLDLNHKLEAGTYRCVFGTEEYYKMRGELCFYPSVQIDFFVHNPEQHYHIPLLLSPYGYSTYRGS